MTPQKVRQLPQPTKEQVIAKARSYKMPVFYRVGGGIVGVLFMSTPLFTLIEVFSNDRFLLEINALPLSACIAMGLFVVSFLSLSATLGLVFALYAKAGTTPKFILKRMERSAGFETRTGSYWVLLAGWKKK